MNEVVDHGMTPIFVAARRGHFDIVQYLVEEANADPNKAHD
ncbi:MAG: ankyrin repeat domain-containing protein [Opitutales bacterium]